MAKIPVNEVFKIFVAIYRLLFTAYDEVEVYRCEEIFFVIDKANDAALFVRCEITVDAREYVDSISIVILFLS